MSGFNESMSSFNWSEELLKCVFLFPSTYMPMYIVLIRTVETLCKTRNTDQNQSNCIYFTSCSVHTLLTCTFYQHTLIVRKDKKGRKRHITRSFLFHVMICSLTGWLILEINTSYKGWNRVLGCSIS